MGFKDDVPWTDGDVMLLKSLWTGGLSASKIGNRIGRTRSAVIGKINRLNLQRNSEGLSPQQRNGHGTYGPRKVRLSRQSPSMPNLPAVRKLFPAEPKKIVPIAPIIEPQSESKLITDLRSNQCRFSTSDNERGEHLFCGAQTSGGPWCDFHRTKLTTPNVRGRPFVPRRPET